MRSKKPFSAFALSCKTLSCLILFLMISQLVKAQDEQFTGQNKLTNCEVILNISDRKKDSLQNKQITNDLKNVELVWIYIDKETRKTKVPNIRRVYLVSETLKSGNTVQYLVPSEIYKSDAPPQKCHFPNLECAKSK